MQSEISQRILMSRRQCAVYNIPPASTARGHCTDDWKGKKILLGFIQVYSLGLKGGVYRLYNSDLSLFAEGKFTKNWEHSVDRCYDSGRYFAISVQNSSGQRATLGLGFDERNDAFDFVGALTKYKEQVQILQDPDKYLGIQKNQDFSLKSGEKISLSFNTGVQLGGPSKSVKSSVGLKKLAPPPKSGGGLSKPPSASFPKAPPATIPQPSTQPPMYQQQPPTYQQQPPASGASLYSANWGMTGGSSGISQSSGGGQSDAFSFGSPALQNPGAVNPLSTQQPPLPPPPPPQTGGGTNLIDLD